VRARPRFWWRTPSPGRLSSPGSSSPTASPTRSWCWAGIPPPP